ncbi:MAG: hypothetical protein HY905_04370 [Deltaproteobacteria bacterium]|nr:hypothetical protein [Deltaproteobacteria bacterium]
MKAHARTSGWCSCVGSASAARRLRVLAVFGTLGAGLLGAGCDDGPTGAGANRYLRLAPDVAVAGVSLFQSVEVPLWVDGEERTELSAVVVDGKAATIVVRLEPGPEFDGREVTVALGVDRGTGVRWQETSLVPSGPSSLDRPDSLAQFELAAEQVSGVLSIAVAVLDPLAPMVPAGTPNAARYPADGSTRAVELRSARDPVRLVLIPIRYARDGNEYVPDVSPEQIELYRETLMAAYPAVAWDIAIHEEVFWDRAPSWSGFNFGALNEYVSDLKASEDDIPQSHYYSLVAPDVSFAAYCTPVCVAGESYLVTEPSASNVRVGAGIGFTGTESAWTMVHELGHVFGRGHSGCSVPRDDRSFPYAGGTIGVWGRDPRDGRFWPPATSDFMGYCTPQWVSDYTWNLLFERLEDLAGLGAKAAGDRYRMLYVDFEEGVARWGAETRAGRLDRADRVAARYAGEEPGMPEELPIIWQSDYRHAAILVPSERAVDLQAVSGIAAVPVP